MESVTSRESTPLTTELRFDLGSFEGFNFRSNSAIERLLSGEEVLTWDHDALGEAEFWPAGDHEGVALLFAGQNAVTADDIRALDRLLGELGSDSVETLLKIYYLLRYSGVRLDDLEANAVEDLCAHVFMGGNFLDVRREAAYELFELYYPDEYSVWEKTLCDGLIFDTDRFLDSPTWTVVEVNIGSRRAVLVVPD